MDFDLIINIASGVVLGGIGLAVLCVIGYIIYIIIDLYQT